MSIVPPCLLHIKYLWIRKLRGGGVGRQVTQEIVQMPREKRIVQVGDGKEKLLIARMGKGHLEGVCFQMMGHHL